MKMLTKKIWFAALLAVRLVAQTTNNLSETQFHERLAASLVVQITNILVKTESQPAEDTTYYSEAELDSILEEISYTSFVPKIFHSYGTTEELFCYLVESDTDAKYIDIFYEPGYNMLNIVVRYEDTAEVELYGVTHNLGYIRLATYHTNSPNSLWFVIEQQNNTCFRGYKVFLRSKKLYRDMYRYMPYLHY